MYRALASISPRYFPSTNYHPLFVAMTSDYNYAYFAQDANRWDSATEAFWGSHDICPSLMQFHISRITRVDLSTISQAGRWGNPKKQSQGMSYLLLVPSQEAEEEKRFGLVGVWVHPNQFLLSSLKEAVKKLTLLITTKEDWYYTLVWVSENTQYLPLSNARQISILVDGAPSRSTCGHLSQLEVCQLLHSGGVVIYPGDLNGGLEPVQVTLPKLPLWEMGSTSKDPQLQITLPRISQGESPEAVPLWLSTPVSSPHSVTECPSVVVTGPSLDRGDCRPLIEPNVQNARGILHLQYPPIQWPRRRETPQIQGRHSRVTWSNHLPPLMGLHRQIWPISQLIPAAPPHPIL